MEADWVQEGRRTEAGPWVSRFGCLGGPIRLDGGYQMSYYQEKALSLEDKNLSLSGGPT